MPVPGPHEVLVRIASVGVCGSDVHYYEHGRIGRFAVDEPLVLGHEASGVVEALGSAATRLAVGQRVSLEPGVPDFPCAQCLAGRYNLCTDMRFYATPPIDGSFAELVTIHEQFAHPCRTRSATTRPHCWSRCRLRSGHAARAGVAAGSRVLVTGAGPVGLVVVQVARALGAADVVISDVNAGRLVLAVDLGATTALDVATTSLAATGLAARRAGGVLGQRRRHCSRRSPRGARRDGWCWSAWAARRATAAQPDPGARARS